MRALEYRAYRTNALEVWKQETCARVRCCAIRRQYQVFIRINGVQHYLWRAVDQDGIVLDVLVQSRRNTRAACAKADR